jgi:hypothetical protein
VRVFARGTKHSAKILQDDPERDDREGKEVSTPDRRWLFAIYGSLLVPFVGPALLIVASSVLYYAWRSAQPDRARWLNKHAWIAIGLNACLHLVLVHVLGWAWKQRKVRDRNGAPARII